ncbi:leucine rich repeat protein [Ichthyophthirius multifiliis]|uniref:Leucine rich repeat protein n=1 Tax=Ichthyophthirius multifiliis TaxID=5932 RepID=G0QPI2_ICHMU|nr:leucine rich repeat protein [Ichthyophthirius multifiliis]EGR32874.1 leucine rich repeat protein [Ichthyophthirius multifiliis]|eukprot:XP_004036860.1 leucine rich repeat protein [Ichthyophthirius multifiliis]
MLRKQTQHTTRQDLQHVKTYKNQQKILKHHNKLLDNSVQYLLEGLLSNRSFKKLNLSKNFLTCKICPLLRQVLEQCYLQELYLYWNQISGKGGIEIFEGLKENQNLHVLDISSNNLGKTEGNLQSSCIQSITQFFIQNKKMIHLDLSNNQFDFQQSLEIAKALEKNNTIYGFHFQGNIGYVDSRGFLIVNELQEKEIAQLHTQVRINGCKSIENFIKLRETREKDLQNCCWICEGWQEMEFTWNVGISGEIRPDPIFIHFNFEDYRANYFRKDSHLESKFLQKYVYSRMVPPGDLFYFFSGQDSSEIAQDLPKKVIFQEETCIQNVFLYENCYIDVYLKELNFQKIIQNKGLFYKYESQNKIQPRKKDQIFIPAKQKKFKYKWKLPQSLFAKWKADNEDIIKRCFEFDWKYGKIGKIVRNEEDEQEVANFFSQRYAQIKNFYKFYASKSPVGDIWAIQNGVFLEFIDKIKIIDNKLVKDADINIKWVATVSSIPQSDKTNPRNPVQGINRYQIMEILIRIAEEKYILKQKKAQSYLQALQFLWEEHLFQELSNESYNPQIWRNQRYWNEECDTCLKFYKPILEHVYKKYAKLKVKPGQPPFMCLEELQNICTQCGFNELAHFGPQIPLLAFNFSMMTQIDEINSDRIFQMSLLEFMEAVARIAEDVSLEPIEGIRFVDQDWEDLERRKNQPLGHKLEAFIVKLLQCCCDSLFSEKYPKIKKSFFTIDQNDEEYELISP